MAGRYFPLDGPRAFAELESWEDSPSELTGQQVKEGLLMLLTIAEVAMVGAGIGPQIVISEKGVVPTLGAAKARLGEVSPSARTLYLGCYGAARRMHSSVRRPFAVGWQRSSPDLGLAPAVAGIIAVGLAALIGGAWYASAEVDKQKVIVDGEKARAAQVASTVVTLATPYITSGLPVPPSIMAPLTKLATYEKTVGQNWGLVGGVSLATLVAGAWLGSSYGD